LVGWLGVRDESYCRLHPCDDKNSSDKVTTGTHVGTAVFHSAQV
jgi:hypothetical protein